MPTPLNKPVIRETNKVVSGRPVILTIAPAGSQSDALIGLRLKGTRTQYVTALSKLYIMAAMWHGEKLKAAKKAARKNGIAWRIAKKQFERDNSIAVYTTTTKEN